MDFNVIEAERLARIFNLSGKVISVDTIKNGNINQTYDVVLFDGNEKSRFIFQRINTYVFKNPRYIMSNIEGITSHIRNKIEKDGGDVDSVMLFYHTIDGKNYCVEEGGFWRVAKYVPGTIAINESNNLSLLYEAGRGFGTFQCMLSDYDASKLYATIPDFHNTRKRCQDFFAHVDEDPCGRVASVDVEIAQIKRLFPLGCRLNEMIDQNLLPLRVTHNDTKINNILFDESSMKAKTVIDLDTVMPGLVAHDFGDAIRFAASTTAEDEPNIAKTELDFEKYESFTKGFLEAVGHLLTENEINTLALGAFTMTYELVVRFLDDYITGDKYFKLNYPEHNLVRTKCQLKLALDMEKKLNQMQSIIAKYASD